VNTAIFQIPFVQIALPIMITLLLTVRVNSKAFDTLNRRLDDMRTDSNRSFDEVIKRLDRIETKLDDHSNRIVRLEERTSPLVRS
jgi:tetrahydromethanopterin S-methyltransferase subunit G